MKRRAVLLLEIIVALSIMVFALGVISAQLVGGLRMIEEVDEQTRAIQFTDRMLAVLELDPEAIAKIGEEQQIDGDFGRQHEGWFWRATLIPIPAMVGLGQVSLEILHQEDPTKLRTIEGARVVRAVRLLKAAPQPIDVVADFGVPEEQAALFAETSPFPEINPGALDPQLIAQLITPETLMEILPVLMPLLAQMSGGQLPQDLSPEDLIGMLNGERPGGPAGPGGDGGGNPEAEGIRGLIESALGDQISESELDKLMNDIGGGTGTSGNGGRGIGELDAERDRVNGRTGFKPAGKGP
jgi:hypothetical protein